MFDNRMMSNPVMITLNILTFSMDVIAVLLALTFSHSWGRNVYNWLVLFPIWVGIGFLIPIIMATPVHIILSLLQSKPNLNVTAGQSILAPWVRAAVFTSFVGQGIALITAFVLYALGRWNHIMKLKSSDTPPFSVAIIRLSRFAFVMAVLVASLHLSWAFGSSLGFPDELLRNRASNFYVFHLVFGIIPLLGAIGIISLSKKLLFNRIITPLIMCWIGAGSMFTWGSWLVLGDVLKGSSVNSIGGPTITSIVMALTGLSIAIVIRAMIIGIVNNNRESKST